MKNLFTICVTILMTAGVFLPQQANAQSPDKMSYQAVMRDGSDNLITSSTVGMRIQILQDSEFGAAVYVETHTPTTNANGLVSLEIGTGTVVNGDFTTVDWSNGPYFIKTETDPTGGTSYTITGTTQLMSVPYALHAKTAETVTGGITESDPVYGASQAANITSSDITNLSNLMGTNSGDQDISGITTNANAITAIQSEQLTQNNAIALNTAKVSAATGTQTGEMQYWNGAAWVTVAAGTSGQKLSNVNGIPTWIANDAMVDPISLQIWIDVTSPTGEIWMDRNLGATQVATSSIDAASYGDLYQWGRGADGHESRTSSTTSTLSTTDNPGHGDFITDVLSPNSDWRSPQNDNLWQGVSGTNNPCPSDYRLPTEAELEAERTNWSTDDAAGAFGSPLKLPMAGFRYGSGAGIPLSRGGYWTSTVSGTLSRRLGFSSSSGSMTSIIRSNGYSVRCIKD